MSAKFAPKTLHSYLEICLLISMYEHGKQRTGDIDIRLFIEKEWQWTVETFRREPTASEVKAIIQELFENGLIEPYKFKCRCNRNFWHHQPERILKHADSFKLTGKGRKLVTGMPLFN